MPGLFERANELAIRAVGRRLSYTAATPNTTVPSNASDGFDLLGAPVAVVIANFSAKTPATTPTANVDIYLFYGSDNPIAGVDTGGWQCVTYQGALAYDSQRPLVERVDCAGASKIALVFSSAVDGTPVGTVGRAILE